MKKIVMVCVAFLFWCTSVASAAEIILFKNASAAGWDIPVSESYPEGGFKQRIEKEGLLKDGAFPTEVLARIAYNVAKERKMPEGNLPESDFKKLFWLTNNLPFEGMITVDEFRRRGPAGQFVLPNTEARASTEPVAAMPSPKEVPAVVAVNPTKELSEAIATLKQEVAKLKADGSNQKALKELTGRLATLGTKLDALEKGQTDFASSTALKNVQGEIAKLQAEMQSLSKLPADVQAMQGRITTLEQKPLGGWGWGIVAALGVLALGIVASFTINWSRGTKATVAVHTVKKEVQAVAAEVAHIKKVGGFLEVQLPNFDWILSELSKTSGSRTFEVFVGEEYFQIMARMMDDGLLAVEGIKGQTKGVKPENLKTVIYRAAKVGDDGAHRIVGVTQAEIEVAGPETVSVVAKAKTVHTSTRIDPVGGVPAYLKKAA